MTTLRRTSAAEPIAMPRPDATRAISLAKTLTVIPPPPNACGPAMAD
jgi:hypothetical protein